MLKFSMITAGMDYKIHFNDVYYFVPPADRYLPQYSSVNRIKTVLKFAQNHGLPPALSLASYFVNYFGTQTNATHIQRTQSEIDGVVYYLNSTNENDFLSKYRNCILRIILDH